MARLHIGDTTTTGAASFTRGVDGTVSHWNAAAERLLGRPADEVVGCRCHEVLAGRDVFGNAFCGDACPVVRMASRREAVRPFVLRTSDAHGRAVDLRMSVLAVGNGSPDVLEVVHVFEPVRDRSPMVMHRPTADGRGARMRVTTNSLSPRELEVLRCLDSGRSTEDIAQALGLSVHTVRNHIASSLRKLECHSRLEAVSIARRRDLL